MSTYPRNPSITTSVLRSVIGGEHVAPRGQRSITSPVDIVRRVRPRFAGCMQELFLVIALNPRNILTHVFEVARGCLTHVEVHPREVFRPLIREAAAAAVLAHNHTSGDPAPSADDLALTERLCMTGALVGIPILDHLIVGANTYCSLRELAQCSLRSDEPA